MLNILGYLYLKDRYPFLVAPKQGVIWSTVIYHNDQLPGPFKRFLNACVMLFSEWYIKQCIHKNWQSYTQINRGTICVNVLPIRVQPFRGVHCGLIPIRPSFCFEIKQEVHNSSIAFSKSIC